MSERIFSINKEKNRFELSVDGHIAFIEYILAKGDIMFLTHTEVPEALGGKGVGSEIVEKALNYIKDHNYTLAPLCPFVAKYLTKHTDWKSILAPGYHV
ncbi:GNAT family N-acetyltransferase [Flavobacterium sp. 3HN19-14]|uniref:GNAT family N-acetyltransferase n=1 Tax=Flavobacterium sp. 3HN19-14 TaxID=3448133 RepID=UPI003EE2FBB4